MREEGSTMVPSMLGELRRGALRDDSAGTTGYGELHVVQGSKGKKDAPPPLARHRSQSNRPDSALCRSLILCAYAVARSPGVLMPLTSV